MPDQFSSIGGLIDTKHSSPTRTVLTQGSGKQYTKDAQQGAQVSMAHLSTDGQTNRLPQLSSPSPKPYGGVKFQLESDRLQRNRLLFMRSLRHTGYSATRKPRSVNRLQWRHQRSTLKCLWSAERANGVIKASTAHLWNGVRDDMFPLIYNFCLWGASPGVRSIQSAIKMAALQTIFSFGSACRISIDAPTVNGTMDILMECIVIYCCFVAVRHTRRT